MILPQVAQVLIIYWITLGGYLIWLMRTRAKLTRDSRRLDLE